MLILICCVLYWLIFARTTPLLAFKKSWFMTAYVAGLYGVSYAHSANLINFPLDNLAVLIISLIFTKIFILSQESQETIANNIERLKLELTND